MMRKIVIIALMALMPTIGFCQNNQQTRHTWTCTRITTSDYESYVFSKEFYVDFKIDNEESRYTPSNSDVDKAEKLIRKKIACINQDHDNQELCPLIDENLKKYKRQYIGFTDKIMRVACDDKVETFSALADNLDAQTKEFMIVVYGMSVSEKEKQAVREKVEEKYSNLEFYEINGGQEVYDYILIME
jgi:uncharacterized lipoprotein NlpE involved in copper resistance